MKITAGGRLNALGIVLAFLAVLVLMCVALWVSGCEKRLTAPECVDICRDAIRAREATVERECQNAITAALITRESQQKERSGGWSCHEVTDDYCAHDRDLCSKVGMIVCYHDDRNDCQHDVDLCPGGSP